MSHDALIMPRAAQRGPRAHARADGSLARDQTESGLPLRATAGHQPRPTRASVIVGVWPVETAIPTARANQPPASAASAAASAFDEASPAGLDAAGIEPSARTWNSSGKSGDVSTSAKSNRSIADSRQRSRS